MAPYARGLGLSPEACPGLREAGWSWWPARGTALPPPAPDGSTRTRRGSHPRARRASSLGELLGTWRPSPAGCSGRSEAGAGGRRARAPRWSVEPPWPLNRGSVPHPRCGHQDPRGLCGAGRGTRHPAREYWPGGGALGPSSAQVGLLARSPWPASQRGHWWGVAGAGGGCVAGPLQGWWEGGPPGGALQCGGVQASPWVAGKRRPGWGDCSYDGAGWLRFQDRRAAT